MPIYNMVRKGSHRYEPPTWAGGTDAEIVEALGKHYAGGIDLTKYWNVGDERVVSLSAMSATGVNESHAAQDATFVIMNVGGKTLADGTTECAFIVGMKDCLNETNGYMNSINTNAGGWDSCARRTWCNSVFYNAIPSTLRPIFKQHLNRTANGGADATAGVDSVDYFSLPAEYEVRGEYAFSNSQYETGLKIFEYYNTVLNRMKKTTSGSSTSYWTRSPYFSNTGQIVYFLTTGSSARSNASYGGGLSPFGVI